MSKLIRNAFGLSFMGLVLGLSASVALSQQNRSTISGFVFDPNRRPVGQITVELANEFNSVLARIRTDGSGRFFFSGLAQGRYTVKALPFGTGFMEQSVDFELTGIGVRGQSLTENAQKDIYLRARKSAEATPFKNAVIYAQEVPREAEALFKDAVSDLDRDRPQTGIASLERAVEIFPTYFAALQKLGSVRLVQERYQDAIDLFKRALAVNDRSFDCWYGLSYAYYSMRDFKDSLAASTKAVMNRPDSMEANLLHGMTQRILKDFPSAEKSLKQAAKLAEGTSPDVHWQLALLYGKDMNKYAEAAKELEEYLELAPQAPNKEDVKKLIRQFKDKAKQTNS